jgi:hypothetical protein
VESSWSVSIESVEILVQSGAKFLGKRIGLFSSRLLDLARFPEFPWIDSGTDQGEG